MPLDISQVSRIEEERGICYIIKGVPYWVEDAYWVKDIPPSFRRFTQADCPYYDEVIEMYKLPKFGLDPDEWKEVQRLKRIGHPAADAVEQHFKSGDDLPKVHLGSHPQQHQCFVEVDGVRYANSKECPPLVQWMVETGQQSSIEIGL